jgi:polar amino acid transport system ATP-binding protein
MPEAPADPAPPVLLRIAALNKSYGSVKVLSDVALDVHAGEVLALIGASGSGKSTLLRCANSLEEYEAGSVTLDGEQLGYAGEGRARRRLGDRRLSAERARIGMVFQAYNLFPHLTAEENVALGLRRVLRLARAAAAARAAHWLDRVGLAARRGHYPHQLSGGQQQRVALARAVAMEPRLLLLDEITSALDPELVGEVLAVVHDLARGGMTMMIVSHELGFVRDVADRVAFMHAGRIVELGSPARMLRAPATPQLASFVARFHARDGAVASDAAALG